MTKKNKIIFIIIIIIGGFIMNELVKLMSGDIPSQKQVIKTYHKNKETIDYISSYIFNFEKEDKEIFYIKSNLIEIRDNHGRVERKVEFSDEFENHIQNLFNHSDIVLIYDSRENDNYLVFEFECKHSFIFNGIVITKNGNEPSWKFVKLQDSEYISDGVYYFEGE